MNRCCLKYVGAYSLRIFLFGTLPAMCNEFVFRKNVVLLRHGLV